MSKSYGREEEKTHFDSFVVMNTTEMVWMEWIEIDERHARRRAV